MTEVYKEWRTGGPTVPVAKSAVRYDLGDTTD